MCMNGTHRKSFPETSSLYEWRVIYGKEQTNTAWYTNSNSIIHDTDTQFPSHTHTHTHTGMLIKLDSSPQKIEFCHELPTLTSSQTQRFRIDLWREFTREPWRIRVVSLRTIFVTKMSADWQREGLLRLFVCSRQKKTKNKTSALVSHASWFSRERVSEIHAEVKMFCEEEKKNFIWVISTQSIRIAS